VHFEWDPAKAASNAAKHGVTFEEATELFADDVVAFERLDTAHGEIRFETLGPIARGLVLVIWTERLGDVIRIISARPATRAEQARYAKYLKGNA
jgi:uncharacterized DUF497 family protein